tara:strand:+ start:224 stop:382 length:159 start_codon:yes stop_codon:yes gene_type:complete
VEVTLEQVERVVVFLVHLELQVKIVVHIIIFLVVAAVVLKKTLQEVLLLLEE